MSKPDADRCLKNKNLPGTRSSFPPTHHTLRCLQYKSGLLRIYYTKYVMSWYHSICCRCTGKCFESYCHNISECGENRQQHDTSVIKICLQGIYRTAVYIYTACNLAILSHGVLVYSYILRTYCIKGCATTPIGGTIKRQ